MRDRSANSSHSRKDGSSVSSDHPTAPAPEELASAGGRPGTRIEASFPLSPMQLGMLFNNLRAPRSGADITQRLLELPIALDVPRLRRAWRRIVDHHEMLRVGFRWQGVDAPRQEVRERARLPIQVEDWRGVTSTEQRRRLREFLCADRRRGFDLAQAPQARVSVLRLGEAETGLLFTCSHAILDARGLNIVLAHVFKVYGALQDGGSVELPPSRSFRDYVDWLAARGEPGDEDFWRRYLKGVTATSRLADCGSRDDVGQCPFEQRRVRLSASKTAALRQLVAEGELTMNTIVQGALAIVLSRHGGKRKVLFAAVKTCRRSTFTGAEHVVGLMLNTVPLCVTVDPDRPVLGWLESLRALWLELRAHEHTPLEKVIEWSELPPGMPPFESVYVFDVDRRAGFLPAGSRVRSFMQPVYPFSLCVFAGTETRIHVDYDPARFDAAAIDRIIRHMTTVMLEMAAKPQGRIRDLQLLGPAERHQLLVSWNDTASDYPLDRPVHELFAEQAARTPAAIAVSFGDRQLSYGELDRRSNQLARYLVDRGAGARGSAEAMVGLCCERSLEMLVGVLGILKAGGAYVPLDPNDPPSRLELILADTRAALVLTQDRLAADLPGDRGRLVRLDSDWPAIAAHSSRRPATAVSADRLIYVIYTSGSTGRPKGACITHRSVVRLVRETNYVDLGSGEVLLQFAPISFDASTLELWGSLLHGARLVVLPPATPSLEELGRSIREHRVTTLWLTSALFQQMVDSQLESLLSVRQLLAGGETLPVPQVQRVLAALAALGGRRSLINGYGPTENTTFTCCHPMTAGTRFGRSVPIGRPIANTRVVLLDRLQNPVPVGVVGEALTGGDGLARCYLNDPALTARKLVPDPFSEVMGAHLYIIGDRARYLADGSIEFLGRTDHQVKIRGFRVELGEIETLLNAYPDVRQSVVVLREDSSTQPRLVAYVVAESRRGGLADSPPADPPSSQLVLRLRRLARERLPAYMVPSQFVVLDELPLLPSGKLDRRGLPEPGRLRPDLPEEYAPPRTVAEATLARVWERVLPVDRVGRDDNFFELGGDSILSIQVVALAREAGISIAGLDLFQYQTLAELARARGPADVVAEQDLVTGSLPLTPIQRWFFDLELAQAHHFNQSMFLEAGRRLDPERLGRAMGELVHHHDALRLCFRRTDSGWCQEIAPPAAEVQLETVDLTALPAGRRRELVARQAARIQSSLDPIDGPLLRAALFTDRHRPSDCLLIAIHHLAVDTVSWRILLEDLARSLAQLEAGELLALPPKTTSLRSWATRLQEYARAPEVLEQAGYWLDLSWSRVRTLPVDHEGGSNTVAAARDVEVSLGAELTRALLKELPAALKIRIDEALLIAFAKAMTEWTGDSHLLIDLEGHGREEVVDGVDLSRTVGWFTSIFPVLLELDRGVETGALVAKVKPQLRAIPGRGLAYGLARYLSSRPSPAEGEATAGRSRASGAQTKELARRLAELPRAEVSFNYLGPLEQVLGGDAMWRSSGLAAGPNLGPRNRRPHLLEVIGRVLGGRLRMRLTYSAESHDERTVERLARAFVTALEELVAHCRSPQAADPTADQMAEMGWSEADLAALLAETET